MAWGLLRAGWLSSIRYLLWSSDARQDARASEQFSSASGISLLDMYNTPIFGRRKTRTLFILGSGSSINEMTPPQFDHIQRHQSVGINFWFFHDFIPDAFSFDSGKVDKHSLDSGANFQHQLADAFHKPDILTGKPRILFLRPHANKEEFLFPVAPELRHRAWVSGRANLVSHTIPSVQSDLRLLMKKIQNQSTPKAVLPDNGSSVVRLVLLALAQGYENIILCGIDLDSRPHFWLADSYVTRFPQYAKLFPAPDGRPHGTTESTGRSIGNLDFLPLLARAMREAGAGQLLLGSPSSQLNGSLRPYAWPEFASGDLDHQ